MTCCSKLKLYVLVSYGPMFTLESKVDAPVQRAVFTYGRLDTQDRSQVIYNQASITFGILSVKMNSFGFMYSLVKLHATSIVYNHFSSQHGECIHDDVTKWKPFPVYWPLVWGITGHRWIPPQRPVTRSSDVFFDLRVNKRLSKQSRGWWFEMPSHSLWRHCNVMWILSK